MVGKKSTKRAGIAKKKAPAKSVSEATTEVEVVCLAAGTRGTVITELVRALPGIPAKVTKATNARVGAPFAEGTDRYGTYMTVKAIGEELLLRWIPPGTFMMGSPAGERGRFDNEGPQHEVTLTKGYWLAEAAAMQSLWEAVLGTNPSRFKGKTRPVECVSWDDAKALFLPRLNELVPGLNARLPSEAEREYACRAGTTGATYVGEIEGDVQSSNLDRIAVYCGNSPEGTRPVKSKEPNAFGLYDMLGNVYEWCEDKYGPYVAASIVDPRGPDLGSSRVIRGGSWYSFAGRVRAARRYAFVPGCRLGLLGLRLARGPV